MGLVRLLFIFFCVVLIMRLIRRFLLPFLFKKAGETLVKNMENKMGAHANRNDQRKEGEIRVEKAEANKTKKVEEGEYVDYEELP